MFTKNKLLQIARTITKENSPTSYGLSKLLLPSGTLPFYCLTYSYFRWLDDLIDAPNLSNSIMKNIVREQQQLVLKLYSGKRLFGMAPLNQYEQMLDSLIQYDMLHGCRLQIAIIDMLQALMFDAQRRYKIVCQSALDSYSLSLGRAYINAFWALTSDSKFLDKNVYQVGFAAYQTHILRDFYTDLSLGYFNVSEDELIKRGWSSRELSNTDISSWVKNVTHRAFESFQIGLSAVRRTPNTRFRFLCYMTSFKYLSILERIRRSNYCLSELLCTPRYEWGKLRVWSLKTTFFAHRGYFSS